MFRTAIILLGFILWVSASRVPGRENGKAAVSRLSSIAPTTTRTKSMTRLKTTPPPPTTTTTKATTTRTIKTTTSAKSTPTIRRTTTSLPETTGWSKVTPSVRPTDKSSSHIATMTPGPRDYRDAVFVALSKSVTEASDPVKFDREEVDVRESFDRSGVFYAFREGVYWIGLSAGANANNKVAFTIEHNDVSYTRVQRSHTKHNGPDTLSKDLMVNMETFQSLQTICTSTGLYSDGGLQTSLTLFRLTGLMTSSYFFSVARQSDTSGAAGTILPFPEILVNVGDAFVSDENTFLVPIDGVYFFSYSIGLAPGKIFDSTLRANVRLLHTLENYNTNRDGMDITTKGGMFRLKKDDKVFIMINKTSSVKSTPLRQTSFSGFLYEPRHGMPIAWSVAMTKSWSGNLFLAPIPFDEVIVNEGNGWQNANFMFDCKVAGYYYMTFSIGGKAGMPIYVSLFIDGQRKANLFRPSSSTNGADMVSRSVILLVEAESRIYLGAEGKTAIHGTRERQTSFSGFLLYPK